MRTTCTCVRVSCACACVCGRMLRAERAHAAQDATVEWRAVDNEGVAKGVGWWCAFSVCGVSLTIDRVGGANVPVRMAAGRAGVTSDKCL